MYINSANTNRKKLIRVARKCNFFISEGAKHTLVKYKNGDVITTIPRHGKNLNKHTVKRIAERFQEYGCDIEIR